MKKNLPVTHTEINFPADANILSTTDLKGAITYVNGDFIKISGFREDELLGKNHNIVRHPDMPPAAFGDLWNALKKGKSWMGMVKNRCKNGDHYWVSAYVTPIMENGETVEFQSVRTKPDTDLVEKAGKLYGELMAGKKPTGLKKPRLSLKYKMIAGSAVIISLLIAIVLFQGGGAFMGGLIAVGVAIWLLTSLMIHFLLSPLQSIVQHAQKIASNPVGQFIYTGRNDEIGEIAFAMKMLEAESGAIVGRIADSAQQLNGTANTLVEAVEQSRRGIQQQHVEIDHVANSINEMSSSIQDVSSSAQQTAEAADQVNVEARQGQNVVSANRSAIGELAREIESASQVIHQLEESSKDISSVLDVIRGVAEQTNLLALNAAIEAARAGEQGRGFAVVADEVRTLASRTQQSTMEIHQMIVKLQESAHAAVEVMGHSRAGAETAVEQAALATASLENITRAVEMITDKNVQIAAAVEQQSSVSEEVNQNINSIRGIGDINADASNRSAGAAHNAANLAKGLEQLAKQFWEKRR